jgi:hypothetical protein
MTTRLLTVSVLGLLAAGLARADVGSGPKEGEKVAALRVYAVTGEPKDKEVDYAGLRKDGPTVYVFVSAKDFGRPMFRFLRKLVEDLGDDGLVVAVWLTDDVDKSKEYLPNISQYLKGAALTVFGGTAGPNAWALNPDAHLTAVVAHKGKVVKSFGYVSLNETDAPDVVETFKKAITK